MTIVLTACQPKNSLHERQLYVFGTWVNISIWHENTTEVQQAMAKISRLFNQMHKQWHAWKPGRLSDINNALRQGQSIELTSDEATFFHQVVRLSKQSNHYFNPTIGELINLWGFHTDIYPITKPPPNIKAINRLAEEGLTVDNLKLEGLTLRADNKHIWLDFGGIAKGLAVDQAIQVLRKNGINNAIINAGGDLRSIGLKGRKAWKIGIQSPEDRGVIAALIVQQDEAIFTSGNYQRYGEFNGQRYAHIIAGETGQPVNDILSVTVIADNGITADAAATAITVAGQQDWMVIARQMGIDNVLIITQNSQCIGTAQMINRLKNTTLQCDIVSINP